MKSQINAITSALKASLKCYDRHSQQTGRTTDLLTNAPAESIIVVPSVQQARWVTDRLNELNSNRKSIRVISVQPSVDFYSELQVKVRDLSKPILFEHDWINQYLESVIDVHTHKLLVVSNTRPLRV